MCQQLLGGALGRVTEGLSVTFSVLTLVGAQVVYWVLMSNFLYNTGEVIYGELYGILFCFILTVFCLASSRTPLSFLVFQKLMLKAIQTRWGHLNHFVFKVHDL